ncbi:MAG: hypothetical protein ABW007_00065 [Chitinophagaceae bacterium]
MGDVIHVSFEMAYQKGEDWINYYELHWRETSDGMWKCVDDGRAMNFFMANKIGLKLDQGNLPSNVTPDTKFERDREIGARFQHIYKCCKRGYIKVPIPEA